MLKLSAVVLALSAIAGCATQTQVDASVTAAAREPLVCTGAEQCALYWRRTQSWIAGNSKWKIQIATDTVISTFTPVRDSIDLGYQAVRTPYGTGTEVIEVTAACDNIFGCRPHADAGIAQLKAFVRAGTPVAKL